jgi:hypothetical protein
MTMACQPLRVSNEAQMMMSTIGQTRRARTRAMLGAASLVLHATLAVAQPVAPAPFPSPPATNNAMPAQQMPAQPMPPPMQQMPGQGMPGQMPQMPGQAMPGQAMPGQGMPAQMPQMPGQAMPGQMQQMPGQAMPGQMQQMPGQAMPGAAPFGQPAPLLPEGAIDVTGMSGVRQLQQYLRMMSKATNAGSPQTPAGWIRTQAPQAPAVFIEHPADWRGTLIATQNMGVTAYAQARVVSGDGRNMFEGETLANTQPIPSAQIAQVHVDRLARQLGARAMLLIDDWQEVPAAGIFAVNVSVRAFDTGDYVVFIVAGNVTNVAMERSGYSIGNIAYKVIVGPKQTFSQLTPQIYIPMMISANW